MMENIYNKLHSQHTFSSKEPFMSVSDVNLDEFDKDSLAMPSEPIKHAHNFYEKIFSQKNHFPFSLTQHAIPHLITSELEYKTGLLMSKRKADGGIEGGLRGTWGGKDGPTLEVYAKGDAQDGQGNYIQAEIQKKNDGTIEYEISVGHRDKNDTTDSPSEE